MTNADIADAFAELADRLALTDEKPFRYMAYRKADETLRELGESVAVLSRDGRLREIDGIGPAIEEKIEQLLETGTFPALERAREDVDDTLLALTRLPGIGPATARKVFAATDHAPYDELLALARRGELATGNGVTRKVVDALASAAARPNGGDGSDATLSGVPLDPETGMPLPGPWFRRDQAHGQFDALVTAMEPIGAIAVELLGDYARGCEVVPGIDVLCDAADPATARAAAIVILDDRGYSVVAIDDEPLAIVTPSGMPASITIAHPDEHVRSQLVGPPAWTRFEREDAACAVAWELRDSVLDGPLTIADAAQLAPELIVASDIRGDLHGHSDWSDGRATILEMARAARDRGDEYYLVSDHSAPYAMVGGLDDTRIRAQADEIARVNEQLQREHETRQQPAFRVLHGSEVEILADGSLGLADATLERLDWVVASIHVAQRQTPDAILERMRRVVANPLVDAIGHPTSRRLLRRHRTALDVDALIAMAVESAVVLEINANPDRLDLDSRHARHALASGVLLAINCDAHRPANLDLREHGVAVARRAGARAQDVVNCRSVDDLLAARRRFD